MSVRHLSFLETGRARPSPQMIDRLGDALQLPLDARNTMLLHAGFAARYAARDWAEAEMVPIRAAVTHMLTVHEPYPAIAIDRLWSVQQMNRVAAVLFGPLGVGVGDSLLDLMMSDHLPPLVENWAEVAHHAAHRLRLESAAQGGVPRLDMAAAHLSAVGKPRREALQPVIPTVLRMGDQRLAMFTTLSQFGTPEDVTLDALRVELYFPADQATRELFEALAAP
ncbi:hypothetical protein POI8812_00491 [Pontivivens insulae]|uniref:HTH cro/C1-type domain-containing protein n=2 Tax=Pontivivens insulae TaxID=1639689 RepID=A0A2R8A7I9_9RHOB|nr:hypothetical protein POI8812_00491 [Pontivivens insulae]